MNADETRRYLFEQLLPLWVERGIDERFGGFHNRLKPDLTPLEPEWKRVLVQARQLWVFSRAAIDANADLFRPVAEAQFDFYCAKGRDERLGGWFLTLEDRGEPLDRTKDTYNHAFALFALAAYYELTQEPEALRQIEHTLEILDTRLREPAQPGFLDAASEDWVPRRGLRRQNPHMHLLEAFLALYRALGDREHLARAQEMLELFRSVFFDAERGQLREFFDDDWTRLAGTEGDRLEPGHHFEWAWLLCEHARLSGDSSLLPSARKLFDFASECGVDAANGGVYDEIDPSGAILKGTKRVWPQTEYLRAATLLAPDRVPEILKLCRDRYIIPEHGAWNEQTDRSGTVVSNGINASSIYHIYGALACVCGL